MKFNTEELPSPQNTLINNKEIMLGLQPFESFEDVDMRIIRNFDVFETRIEFGSLTWDINCSFFMLLFELLMLLVDPPQFIYPIEFPPSRELRASTSTRQLKARP